VLSNSVLLGFPYADVPEMGTSFVVVTDNDPALAATLAHDWARLGWERRAEFQGTLLSPCECLEIAQRENVPGPVLLLDMGDNVGGGSPGDGTILAHELQNLAAGPAFMCLYDPQAQAAARSAGVGARLTLTMGGKTDRLHGPPLIAEIAVVSLADGRFEEPQPRHGGYAHFDQGPTAIVETSSGLTVMLTSQRMPPFSIQQLSTCGLDPAAFRFIVTKGVNAPLAAYAPVCPTKFRVNTPGCTTADMRSLAYQHRRRPMFPWEDVATWPT
jgi:microcystin degradation protein MlrC